VPVPTISGVVGGTATGVVGGAIGGVATGQLGAPPPPAEPVRVGGAIKAPALVTKVDPLYPEMARQAHIQGDVVLEATVGVTGEVQTVKVLKSVAMLDQSAMDAVKKWRYSPLTLNGTAVPFILTVTVHFTSGL
jgi:protein TonB